MDKNETITIHQNRTETVDANETISIGGNRTITVSKSETATVWGGTKVRFRIIGGTFRIVVRGRGINLSYVGKGSVILNGAGTDDDGTYAVNGGDYNLIPAFALPFALSAASNP